MYALITHIHNLFVFSLIPPVRIRLLSKYYLAFLRIRTQTPRSKLGPLPLYRRNYRHHDQQVIFPYLSPFRSRIVCCKTRVKVGLFSNDSDVTPDHHVHSILSLRHSHSRLGARQCTHGSTSSTTLYFFTVWHEIFSRSYKPKE